MGDLVQEQNNKITTTSLLVAEKFGKEHHNVLKKIDALAKSQSEFWGVNFNERDYVDSRGKTCRMFEMTEEGFAMIAMRFTGKAAEEWQIKFISAFQFMRKEIARQKEQRLKIDWQEARENSKCIRTTLTTAISALSKLADNQGGAKNRNYYPTITKRIYKELFGDSSLKAVRDKLDALQLTFLSICEEACADEIDKLVALDTDYHIIYAECVKRVIATVEGLSASKLTSKSSIAKLVWEKPQ